MNTIYPSSMVLVALLLAGPVARAADEQGAGSQRTDQRLDALEDELDRLRAATMAERSGTTKFIYAGDAGGGFSYTQHGYSTFYAGFSPMILWRLGDRLFVEIGLDFDLIVDSSDESVADIDLSLANLSYAVSDNLLLAAGRFPVPFGNYHTHIDPRWINKLPDDPLPFGDDSISPEAGLGLLATGAATAGTMMFTYGAYVINGPRLNAGDPQAAGSLDFNNFDDMLNNRAVGGRLGFQPWPWLQIGYSFQYARLKPSGLGTVDAMLHAVDLNCVVDLAALMGKLTVQGDWVWSLVDEVTYDPQGALGFGPLRFKNHRNGGFVLVAYRPMRLDNAILSKLEVVFRYDRLYLPPDSPGGTGVQQRFTTGLDLWLAPSAVLKAAYEYTQVANARDFSALLLEFDIGF